MGDERTDTTRDAATMHYARQRAEGTVAELLGDALTDAASPVLLPFPVPDARSPKTEVGPTLPVVATDPPVPMPPAEELVARATAGRPDRPQGKLYGKNREGSAVSSGGWTGIKSSFRSS